jgi:ABC-type branched-subunit amino acid transport system substrate-binding protein
MRRLLKYAIVLAIAVAIGGYIILGPLSPEDNDIAPIQREATLAPIEPAPLAAHASPASIDEEVVKRVALETAKVKRRLLAGKAPAPGSLEASSSASSDARPATESTAAVTSPSGDAVPATAAASVSNDGPQDAKPANDAAHPAAPTSIAEELDYLVAKRLGSFEGWRTFLAAHGSGAYAQTARVEVDHLFLAEKATAPATAEASNGAPTGARPASETMGPPPRAMEVAFGDAAPAEISNGASPDARAVNEATRPALPVAGTDVAAGTEVALLSPEDICKRDGDRLARLLSTPSSDEVARFARELACEKLRPQILGLMESLAHAVPAPAAVDVSNSASGGAPAVREGAFPASSLAGTDVAAQTPDETCKRDGDRLARLRGSPSAEEAQRLASELSCESLRPQVQRLMESLGLVGPAVSPPNDSSRSPEHPVADTQTRTPVAAAKSIAALPFGRVAVLSTGSIDSVPVSALANPGVSAPAAVGDVSPPQSDGVEPTIQGVSGKEILFGIAAPFSGASRELGRQMKIGVETAFSQINSAGGVNGRLLRLVAADDGYEPEKTADAMHLLYDKEKVFGFIGNVGTPTAAVALPFVLDHRALFFGAFTGASLLRGDPPDRYVFNYRASDAEETRAVVHYLVKVRRIQPKEIAVFAQQDSYGDSGYSGVQKAVRSLPGNNPDVIRLNYKRNTIDVQGAVDSLHAYKGQIKAVVMIASYRAAAKFIEKTRDLYPSMIYTNASFVGSTALADELMLLGPQYATGVIVTQVVPAINSRATIVLKYKKALDKYFRGESPDYVSFEGYIDASILAEAVKRIRGDIDTEKLVEELERMHDFDLGLGAPVTFSPNDHQGSHKVLGTQLDQTGHYQPIDLE